MGEVNQDIMDRIPDDALTIMTTDDKIHPFSVNQNEEGSYKPKGLWYSHKNEWVEWVRSEMPDWEKEHLHLISLDYTDIIRLKSHEDILKFSDIYAKPISTYKDIINKENKLNYSTIDWYSVAKKYKGIEIIPYIYSARYDVMWYYGWDVASGCIWDSTAIKNIKRL